VQENGWVKKYRSRKWRLTIASIALEFAVVIAGVVGIFAGAQGMSTLIVGGFSAIGATMAFYFTVNTLQKHDMAKNYRTELDTDVRTDGR